MRRSLGYDLSFAARVLRGFTSFADAKAVDHVTVDLFLRWKERFGKADNNTWSARLGMVRVFASWLQGHDARTEVPPPGLIPESCVGGDPTSTPRTDCKNRRWSGKVAVVLWPARLDMLDAVRADCGHGAAHQRSDRTR